MSTIIGTTLNADTIRKTGGSLGTDIRIKNTSVYESEGGTSVTQNLVQGLVKVFNSMSHDSGTPTTVDSFNVASMLDSGTGNYRVNYTNNMTHAKDCVLALSNYRSGSAQLKNICLNENTGFVTSHHAIIMGEGSWTLKDGECNNTIAVGDLA